MLHRKGLLIDLLPPWMRRFLQRSMTALAESPAPDMSTPNMVKHRLEMNEPTLEPRETHLQPITLSPRVSQSTTQSMSYPKGKVKFQYPFLRPHTHPEFPHNNQGRQ